MFSDRGSTPLASTRQRLRIGYNPESFSTKSTLLGGINRFHDESPLTWDEIRLDGGWVDLISSKLCLDFICRRQISSRSDFILAFLINLCYTGCREVIIMAENKLADLSMDFAVKVLKMTDGIKGHYSLINQLERSATSSGANIREAKYAHSKADFVSKFQISHR